MTLHSTKPPARLRCRRCGSTTINLTGKTQPGIKPHHTHSRAVKCVECGHEWWSRSRAAEALYPEYLEAHGQNTIPWDEMHLKKPLTRPALPD